VDDAVNYGISKKADSILLNGDVIDAYQLSKYQPDPRKRNFWQEIEAFKEFIKVLKEAINVPIYYKMGNHCERYEKKMIERCPEFLGIPQFNFESVMGLHDLGVTLISDQRRVNIGNLAVYHGHEVGLKSANVNPARSLFLKIHANGMVGHLHRTSQHTEPSIEEDITCWSLGHLGNPHPPFCRNNKWNHGIARIEKDEEGNYEVINVNLTKNKLYRM